MAEDYTWGIFFPKECPEAVQDEIMDKVVELVYGWEREGWDAFIFGRKGECTLVEWDDVPGE